MVKAVVNLNLSATRLKRLKGIMLLEVLISLIVLSFGYMSLSRSIAYAASTSLHMEDELRATDISKHLISAVELFALSLPDNTTQLALETATKDFSRELETELNNSIHLHSGFACQSVLKAEASVPIYEPIQNGNNTQVTETLGDLAEYLNKQTPQCVTLHISNELTPDGAPSVNLFVAISRVARAGEGIETVMVENRQLIVTKESKTAVKAWY